MRTLTLLAMATLLSGCAASGTQDSEQPQEITPLHLWSHHKSLELPVSACGDRAFNVLRTLGFSNVVRNDNYSYGNFAGSRAAVKCVEMPQGSFVYFAVASTEKLAAEDLRNRISSNF